jgi:hypothetical protein
MITMNRRMRMMALGTLVGAGISTAGVAFAGQTVTGTMHVEPTTVEPGGSYVISNDPASPCLLGQVTGDTGGVRPGAWQVEPDEQGNWEVTIEVPDSGPPDAMGNPTPFPEGDYEQHAFCEQPDAPAGAAAPAQEAEFAYDPVTVTVAAPEEEPAPEPEPEPQAPAAEAAQEAPDFTG